MPTRITSFELEILAHILASNKLRNFHVINFELPCKRSMGYVFCFMVKTYFSIAMQEPDKWQVFVVKKGAKAATAASKSKSKKVSRKIHTSRGCNLSCSVCIQFNIAIEKECNLMNFFLVKIFSKGKYLIFHCYAVLFIWISRKTSSK